MTAERDEDAVGRFIERFASVLTEAGIPRMPARVFAALLASDSGRLTAADLAGLLMARWTAVLREGVGLLGADTPAGARMTESVQYFDFVSAELPRVVVRWQQHKAMLDADRVGRAGRA